MCPKIKMLYILNIANRVNNFSHTSMLAAQKMGIEFHIAGNWSYSSQEEIQADEEKYGIKIHQIDFIREPYNIKNIKAYKQLKKIVKEEQYDVIHSNTPIGGVLGRLVGKACNVKTNIYQAHGFHFYKGAPMLNWLLYYPIEKLLARYTDALITINKEDYEAAKKFKLRNNGNVYYVPGVGIDVDYINMQNIDKSQKREEIGINNNEILLVSIGELNNNKNHSVIIKALSKINNGNTHYALVGVGPLENELKSLAKSLNVEERVHFMGYRNDVFEILRCADVFCFPSFREGLSAALMEAMAVGLPVVCSNIRGNTDLIEDGNGGYLCNPDDVDAFADKINLLVENENIRVQMSQTNIKNIEKFDNKNVRKDMFRIYKEVLDEKSPNKHYCSGL